MPERINLKHLSVVLNRPRYPENIGAAARAIRNMGIARLLVVNPGNYDPERAEKMATHAAVDIIRNLSFHDDLETALAPFQYVVGTTARLGGERKVVIQPRTLAANLIPISQNNEVAVVFGPEDRGLTNEEIRLCHTLVTIPTSDFSSLNLAQAVMVLCYELYTAARAETPDYVPRLANRHELDGMYTQLRDVLVRICYLNPENPDYWMNRIRQFFNRLPLQSREVSIIRGVCRQVNWYGKKCFEEGRQER